MDVKQVLILQAVQSCLQPPEYFNDDNKGVVIRHLLSTKVRGKRALTPKVAGYVERLVPTFLAHEFKSYFGMLPFTYEIVRRGVACHLRRTRADGNMMIPPSKQFLIALWRMATPDSYRSICQRFGVAKSTAILSVRRLAYALSRLSKRFIQWPQGGLVREVVNGFFHVSAFPGTIGATDGTHINTPEPKENPEAYVNRKGHRSIQLQAVCDHERLFTHIYVRNVGSVHDARLFRLSQVYDFMSQGDKFPNDSHLVGAAACALNEHLLVPYSDNGHLTLRQRNFNFCLCSSRMPIERSFGLLKGRWRSLLHNLAISRVEDMSFL